MFFFCFLFHRDKMMTDCDDYSKLVSSALQTHLRTLACLHAPLCLEALLN